MGGAEFGISAQVLQEFYTVVTSKKRQVPLTKATAMQWIERLEIQPCAPITPSHVKLSVLLSERYGISYWDGSILTAAEALGAPIVYTEDLNHGQIYGCVKAVNPFRPEYISGGFQETSASPLT